MTKKDLMEGLNYIDEDLVEEAARAPKRTPRIRRFPLAAAAAVVLAVGVFALNSQQPRTPLTAQKNTAATETAVNNILTRKA